MYTVIDSSQLTRPFDFRYIHLPKWWGCCVKHDNCQRWFQLSTDRQYWLFDSGACVISKQFFIGEQVRSPCPLITSVASLLGWRLNLLGQKWKLLSLLWPFATPWTTQSMGFSRSEYQNNGVGSYSLFQGIFPTQGSNPGLLYGRQILYQLSHQGNPRILERVAYPFSSGSSWPRNQTRVSSIAGPKYSKCLLFLITFLQVAISKREKIMF